MNEEKLLEVIFFKLGDRKQVLVDTLADGAAADFAAYQNLVGQVRGLAAAQMEVNDLLRKIKEADNDD